MELREYYTLGSTGLRVSRLALGTMTFGTEWGWGTDEPTARSLFDRYLDAGGNFVDTADGYTGGASERMVGGFIAARGARDRVVLATKFTFNADPANPNAGGNGRKNILRALEGSLRRLQTDYIDLYILHAWDMMTPAEEVLRTLDDLVRAGKVRHFGLSNVPAWYAARLQTLAELRGYERACALQMEYSLVERNIEHEFVPAGQALGMGVMVWSPLAGGLLSGKYKPSEGPLSAAGRLQTMKDSRNPAFQKFSDRNWRIVAELEAAARELDQPMAAVAVNWAATQPGVATVILGATSVGQLDANLSALSFEIPAPLRCRLDDVSRPDRPFPYSFFGAEIQGMVHGGVRVGSKPPGYVIDVVVDAPGAGVV